MLALVALLLLLLAILPLAANVAAAETNHTNSRADDLTAAPTWLPTDKPMVSQQTKSTTRQIKRDEANRKPPSVVLTRSLYVAGYSRPHPELCPMLGARTRLAILVSSAPADAAARNAVRMTWGHAVQRADVAFAFVLGASPPALRAALDAEDALYGDLVEGRSVDSYSNLTLKTVSMLEWLDTYCPRAPRLLKTDVDMFINVPRLLRFAEEPTRRNATNTVWGKVAQHWRPVHAPRSKDYIPPAQFPGPVFPDFVTGHTYLLTADAARRLLRAAPTQRYLRLEDVFITGVLAARLGVRRIHVPTLYSIQVAPDPCSVQRGLAFHVLRYSGQFDLWRKLFDGKSKCDG